MGKQLDTLCSEHPDLWIIVLLITIFLLLQELTNDVWAQKVVFCNYSLLHPGKKFESLDTLWSSDFYHCAKNILYYERCLS